MIQEVGFNKIREALSFHQFHSLIDGFRISCLLNVISPLTPKAKNKPLPMCEKKARAFLMGCFVCFSEETPQYCRLVQVTASRRSNKDLQKFREKLLDFYAGKKMFCRIARKIKLTVTVLLLQRNNMSLTSKSSSSPVVSHRRIPHIYFQSSSNCPAQENSMYVCRTRAGIFTPS